MLARWWRESVLSLSLSHSLHCVDSRQLSNVTGTINFSHHNYTDHTTATTTPTIINHEFNNNKTNILFYIYFRISTQLHTHSNTHCTRIQCLSFPNTFLFSDINICCKSCCFLSSDRILFAESLSTVKQKPPFGKAFLLSDRKSFGKAFLLSDRNLLWGKPFCCQTKIPLGKSFCCLRVRKTFPLERPFYRPLHWQSLSAVSVSDRNFHCKSLFAVRQTSPLRKAVCLQTELSAVKPFQDRPDTMTAVGSKR